MPHCAEIQVQILTPEIITLELVRDMNDLLQWQNKDAQRVNIDWLRTYRQKIAVALQGERLIGMAVLYHIDLPGHDFVSIHNFIIHERQDIISIGVRLVQAIIDVAAKMPNVAYIIGGAWVQSEEMKVIFHTLNFAEIETARFKLELS
jgi:hypothetical protein